jgi:hypothetical protein
MMTLMEAVEFLDEMRIAAMTAEPDEGGMKTNAYTSRGIIYGCDQYGYGAWFKMIDNGPPDETGGIDCPMLSLVEAIELVRREP